MGALHEGHLSLVDTAKQHVDEVVVTIFVNPKQFAPGEDLDSYPRTFNQDCRLCSTRGVGAVMALAQQEVYPDGYQTSVNVDHLGRDRLCAVSRPHFFRGVATIVLKLLNIVMADVAVFGEKDYQQLQVIKRLCLDLHHPTQIIGSPLVREPSGLAMSSRNRYLSEQQREAATSISKALTALKEGVQSGRVELEVALRQARTTIERAGGKIDYLAAVDGQTLESIASVQSFGRVLIAAEFGPARLIDNIALEPPAGD